MPKLDPKIIQRELDQGQLWPVYWLYGSERMKSRELLKRIRSASNATEESFDGAETDAASVIEAAQSLAFSFGGRVAQAAQAERPAISGSSSCATRMP